MSKNMFFVIDLGDVQFSYCAIKFLRFGKY
jgi:hypothetical protein